MSIYALVLQLQNLAKDVKNVDHSLKDNMKNGNKYK